MAGKIVADTLEHSTAGSLDTQYVVNGSAKAWNSFQGTGTIVFIKSFQCSSLVDANTGDYDVNLTSAMDSTSYSVLVSSGYNVVHNASETLGYANTTTQYSTLHYENNTRYDIPYLSGQINGDLA